MEGELWARPPVLTPVPSTGEPLLLSLQSVPDSESRENGTRVLTLALENWHTCQTPSSMSRNSNGGKI